MLTGFGFESFVVFGVSDTTLSGRFVRDARLGGLFGSGARLEVVVVVSVGVVRLKGDAHQSGEWGDDIIEFIDEGIEFLLSVSNFCEDGEESTV